MLFSIYCTDSYAQKDSTLTIVSSDTILHIQDSILQKQDTTQAKKKKTFENRVDYSATDSIVTDLTEKKVYLYNQAKIKYGDINLEGGAVNISFETKELEAQGIADSNKNITQNPVFKQKEDEYKAKLIKYNFDNKKGFITGVFTKEGDGYLHGQKIKKVNDSTMYISKGMFTTCEAEEPHFALNFMKAKVVPKDKIVTGPAWFSIMGIPMPLALPFGYFPFTSEQKSGFLLPTYGYAANRGYYLRNIGWYFAINNYVDLALQGDIYTNGSLAANAKTNYAKRYKYTGSIEARFEDNKTGIKDTKTFAQQKDFSLKWSHQQDSKANPYSNFSASVNLVSATYNQYATNASEYFNNTTTSSIAYSTRFGESVSFTANLGESYNINTGDISLDLPSVSLSTSQFYPFRSKKQKGEPHWWEDITVSYRSSLTNTINTKDSILFTKEVAKTMKNGWQHSIPISSSIKVLKYFTWTNSISYTERWYTNSIAKKYNSETGLIDKDTIFGFIANRDASFSSSLTTRIYGVFNFRHGIIKAFRHVINPSISFNFTPDFSSPSLGFYNFYVDKDGKKVYYSKTEDGLFGSPPSGKSGVVNFSVGNNLEMKVKHGILNFFAKDKDKDTVTEPDKVVLLESLNFSSGYDLAKDSVNWRPLSINARTTLFKKLQINFTASMTPYVMDSVGGLTNQFLITKEHRLFKRQNSQWDFNLSWQFSQKKAAKESTSTKAPVSPTEQTYSPYVNPNEILGNNVDFSIPWSLNLSLTYSRLSSYVVAIAGYQTNKSATFNVTGDVNLTNKWKVGFTTGYDFINKEYTYTSIDFYRDLHCWEMRMNWIPFGYRQGWNFTIAVKASMLQDLKYQMQDSFQNRATY